MRRNRRHSHRGTRNVAPGPWRRSAAAVLGALLLAALPAAPGAGAAPRAGGSSGARAGRPASKVEVGEFPPDFELPYLTIGKNGKGEPIGVVSKDRFFKLSSRRGKRPVCLIMSSYT